MGSTSRSIASIGSGQIRPSSHHGPVSAALGSVLAAFLVLTAASCGDDADDGSPACKVDLLEKQPTSRFRAGQTFYLPQTTSAECAGMRWALVDEASVAALTPVRGTDGFTRFTPTEPGTYVFELGDGTQRVEVGVVDPRPQPYHNLNYYPSSRSVALVGDEVWVAEVHRPSITRLGRDLTTRGELLVGPWPVALGWQPGMDIVVVAQRGNDALGMVDVASGAMVDAVWVGDEPSNVVVSSDGKRAFVALATEGAVAEVDLLARSVVRRLPAPVDPLGLALSDDGATLYVAGHRTGQPTRYPYGDDPLDEEKDILAVDLATGEVAATFLDVGATLNALRYDEGRLLVAGSRRDPSANLSDPEDANFIHMVKALDPESGETLAETDLTRQASSGGHAVTLHGMARAGDVLWVVAESSDLLIGLDARTFEERARAVVVGRPRGVVADAEAVFVHGAQAFSVTALDADGANPVEAPAGVDPRPVPVAEGQRYFTGAGQGYAQNWACNSCHGDGLTDTMVWNAGPFKDRVVSRPFIWLEGTWPLGWAGYLSGVRNYAFTVNTNVGIRPDTATAENLSAYLSSVMPPPAANGWTYRDGSLSDAAERGKAVYEGAGGCAGCHALPLTTSRARFDEGITDGVTDVPALVGAYRHNVWLKHGQARSLRDGGVAAAEWLGIDNLSPVEIDDLTRYLQELTARDFFVLDSAPRPRADAVATELPLHLTFSAPVWTASDNLTRIRLMTQAGEPVDAAVSAKGRHVTVTPSSPLETSSAYVLAVGADFESLDDRVVFGPHEVPFVTAAAPGVRFEGEYEWVVEMPTPDFVEGRFDRSRTLELPIRLSATTTASGAAVVFDYQDDLVYTIDAVVQGDELDIPPTPLAFGTSFTETTGLQGKLVDDDGDGVADSASGTLTISGPGFEEEGIAWTLGRAIPVGECDEGVDAPMDVDLTFEDGVAVFSWDPAAGQALGFYVTDPGATLPLGPGQTVAGGETYWALASTEFPAGFAGPVSYRVVPQGAVDATEANGGLVGGVELEQGECYAFGLITNQFQVATITRRLQ